MDRKLLIYPAEPLKKKSKFVEDIEGWDALIDLMGQILIDEEGVGLAAPQVGENIRLFLMRTNPDDTLYEAFFNPEIIEAKNEEIVSESCLSFPEISIETKRAMQITFRAVVPSGETVEKTVYELQAQCVQHEIDHLDGITLVNRCSLAEKLEINKKLKELGEKQE